MPVNQSHKFRQNANHVEILAHTVHVTSIIGAAICKIFIVKHSSTRTSFRIIVRKCERSTASEKSRLLTCIYSRTHCHGYVVGSCKKALHSSYIFGESLVSAFNIFILIRKIYKWQLTKCEQRGCSTYANVIKKLPVISKRFQFRSGILFYHSVVIRTEIITTAAYTIMRRLDPPTANYETPNSGSKLWLVRYGKILAPGQSLLWRSKVPQLSQPAYEIAYYNNLSLISACFTA